MPETNNMMPSDADLQESVFDIMDNATNPLAYTVNMIIDELQKIYTNDNSNSINMKEKKQEVRSAMMKWSLGSDPTTNNNNDNDNDMDDEDDDDDDDEGSIPEDINDTNRSENIRKPTGKAFNADVRITSSALVNVIGKEIIPRNLLTSEIWKFIKSNDLQLAHDRRMIQCKGTALEHVFPSYESINMFTMTKELSKLMIPITKTNDEVGQPNKYKYEDDRLNKDQFVVKKKKIENAKNKSKKIVAKAEKEKKKLIKKEKKEKNRNNQDNDKKKVNGFNKEFNLSSALSDVIGINKDSRPQVVKKLHTYFKENNCKDPKDGRVILCDEKLKKVFNNRKSVTMFSMNKYISSHLYAIEDDE